MKHLFSLSILAIAAALPAASFAQNSNSGLTRKEVQAQIAQASQNHTLLQSRNHYPDPQQSAGAQQASDASGYGSQLGGSSQSSMPAGRPLSSATSNRLFAHR